MSKFGQPTGTAATTNRAHPTSPRSEPAAREAYAFACMRCGHGWEQSYEIEHQVDATGSMHVVYFAEGERVPSPLTRPICLNCGATVVRIMRSGQVSMVSKAIASMHQRQGNGHSKNHGEKRGEKGGEKYEENLGGSGEKRREKSGEKPGELKPEASAGESTGSAEEGTECHRWHLSDLLHPFQHCRR
ncbi:hypothetical protein [Streptomyces halobius]|uniref:Uncharacterized protein n=1 Tax=Streptomyces halobius TaxID=2879846 RepID=A0ABY4MF65_9ACTN|nr:hypothetical protein [Streptomyces halobius]UQA94976.1 hypothetical protein K9S39_26760 [Streptomyces halobius]